MIQRRAMYIYFRFKPLKTESLNDILLKIEVLFILFLRPIKTLHGWKIICSERLNTHTAECMERVSRDTLHNNSNNNNNRMQDTNWIHNMLKMLAIMATHSHIHIGMFIAMID